MGSAKKKLAVAAGAVVLVIIVFWFFVIDYIVERIVEKKGTEAVGARVELASADLSLFPMGVTLKGLRVSNPDNPMTNAMEAVKVSVSLDRGKLFERKLAIDEMRIERVRLTTPRKKAAPSKTPDGAARSRLEALKERLKLPSFEVTDPKEILAREELDSLKAIESLKSEVEASKVKWKARLEEILDRKRIEEFKRRAEEIKAASGGGPLGAVGAADKVLSLQKDVREYIMNIESARKDLTEEMAGYRKKFSGAAAAPGADLKRLMKKYSLSAEGLSNLSALIFGPAVAEWTENAVRWHNRLAPMIKGDKNGEDGKKPGKTPDLIVEKALISIELPGGGIEGRMVDFSTEPAVYGKPATFNISGSGLKGLKSVELKGVINHIDPTKPVDRATLRIKGYGLEGTKLTEGKDFTAILEKGLADFDIDVSLGNGKGGLMKRALRGAVSARFSPVSISASGGESGIAKALASALREINSFNLKADISGTIEDYKLGISSDLDGVLKAAVGGMVRAQSQKLRSGLEEEIRSRVAGPLGEAKSGLSGLEAITGELTSRLKVTDEILKDTAGGLPGGIKLPF